MCIRDSSLIDLNRAGVPLVEIVSRPDIRSPEQAKTYVSEVRAILLAIGASDAKMEEGSMRVDANVSVRRPDDGFGTRCEIKNVNSVRSVGRAIEYEARRQIVLIESGESVRQQTRHWDEGDGRTHTLRDKEDADDYRYFLEPDLVPLDPVGRRVERHEVGFEEVAVVVGVFLVAQRMGAAVPLVPVTRLLTNRLAALDQDDLAPVSYTHLRAHETVLDLV